ncbi:ribonuclease H-like domain-containing protein [Mycena vulgaris]|nr:ribonuclease H-like domain-containing protein [Mycena vulgaris]
MTYAVPRDIVAAVVNGPQFRIFVNKYIPAAKIPDRRVLSGPVLDGEAEKSRVIYPLPRRIAAFECWVHQSSLITGNYLSIKAPWMATAKLPIEVIKWFNHHGTALDLLRVQQRLSFDKILALILPVITRWVSQYCSLRQLKKLERAISACFSIASDLKPLAIASNLLQAPTCRLDTVLLCLCNLHRIFSRNDDTIFKSTVIKSLERRWAKTDQELMILAVFLNPYIRRRASNRSKLPSMSLYHMILRTYQRLYGQDARTDIKLMKTFQSYLDSLDYFSDIAMWLDGFKTMYEISLIGCGGFVKLAIRILSIVPNSAGSERIFSTYGLTHTQHRNRLNRPKVYKSTLVRMVRKESHRAAGVLPQRRPQHFRLADDQVKMEAMDADSASPAQDGGVSVGPSATDENEMNFGVVADLLINLAAGEDAENAAAAAAPSIATIPPPRTSASASTIDPVLRLPPYKKIKLADLFEYPAPGT